MARFISNSQKRDPFRNFNFVVLIDNREVAACKKVSGLTASIEAVKFRAGNDPSTVDEVMPGRVSYEPVTLESGLTNDEVFEEWANTLVRNEFSEGGPRQLEPNFRRSVVIQVKDIDNQTVVREYTLHNAWVSKYTAHGELMGDANDVILEQVEIQYEGFTRRAL